MADNLANSLSAEEQYNKFFNIVTDETSESSVTDFTFPKGSYGNDSEVEGPLSELRKLREKQGYGIRPIEPPMVFPEAGAFTMDPKTKELVSLREESFSTGETTKESMNAYQLKRKDLIEGTPSDPNAFTRIIYEYLLDRDGYGYYENLTNPQLVEKWIYHNRYLDGGNTHATLKKMQHVLSTTPEGASKIKNNHILWENFGGPLKKNYKPEARTIGEMNAAELERVKEWWETGDMITDYAGGAIWDLTNLATLFVSSAVKKGATKKLIAPALDKIIDAKVQQLTARGLTKKAIEKEVGIFTRSISKSLSTSQLDSSAVAALNLPKNLVGKTVQQIAKDKGIKGAMAFEMAAAVAVDSVYQQAYNLTDEDYDWNWVQTAASPIFSGIGYSFLKLKEGINTNNINAIDGAENFMYDKIISDAVLAKKAFQEGTEPFDPKDINLKGLGEEVKRNKRKLLTWIEKVQKGSVKLSREEGTDNEFNSNLKRLFWLGDTENDIQGVYGILLKRGIFWPGVKRQGLKHENGKPKDDNFTNWLLDTIEQLPKEAKDEVYAAYRDTIKAYHPNYKNKTLKSAMQMMAADVSEGMKDGWLMSHMSKGFKQNQNFYDDVMGDILDNSDTAKNWSVPRKVWEDFGWLQKQYIKGLVSHPDTTWLNVKGWGTASAANSVTDMTYVALYAGRAGLEHVLGRGVEGGKWWKQAKLLTDLQREKLKMLVDPDVTEDKFLDTFVLYREEMDELLSMVNTVEAPGEINKRLGFPDIDTRKLGPIKKAVEFTIDKMQIAYGVKIIDTFTKSQSFYYHLERQVRRNYGMTYAELLQTEGAYKILNDKSFIAKVIAPATEEALKESFSYDYSKSGTKGSNYLNFTNTVTKDVDGKVNWKATKSDTVDFYDPIPVLAGLIQDIRRIPIIGTSIPFGRFFNNSIAFMTDYSGVSLAYNLIKGAAKGGPDRDLGRLAVKAAVGYGASYALSGSEKEYLKQGLRWDESRGADGSIIRHQYNFPYNAFKATARLMAYHQEGLKIPAALITELGIVFGPKQLERQMDKNFSPLFNFLHDGTLEREPEKLKAFTDYLKGTGANLAQGTRGLDPINNAFKIARGKNVFVPDKKQGSKNLNKALVYMDEFMKAFGVPMNQKEKYSPTNVNPKRINLNFIGKTGGPKSHVEIMLAQIGLPPFQLGTSSKFPEVSNYMNRLLATELNIRAHKILSSEEWKEGDSESRLKLFKRMKKEARKGVTESLLRQSKSSIKSVHVEFVKKIAALEELETSRNLNEIETKFLQFEFFIPVDDDDDLSTEPVLQKATNLLELSSEQLKVLDILMDLDDDKAKRDYERAKGGN